MADFQKDSPHSKDAEAKKLLRQNTGRQVSGKEKSNGSVAKGGKRVGGGPRGGSL